MHKQLAQLGRRPYFDREKRKQRGNKGKEWWNLKDGKVESTFSNHRNAKTHRKYWKIKGTLLHFYRSLFLFFHTELEENVTD